MTPQDSIRKFIIEDLAWSGDAEELTDDFALLDNRVIDSIGIFRVVDHIESEFGVEIDDAELTPSNFGNLDSLARLIAEKRAGR